MIRHASTFPGCGRLEEADTSWGGLQGNAGAIKCGSQIDGSFCEVEQQGGRAELILLKRRSLKMPAHPSRVLCAFLNGGGVASEAALLEPARSQVRGLRPCRPPRIRRVICGHALCPRTSSCLHNATASAFRRVAER